MKEKILGACLFIGVIAFVCINAYILECKIVRTTESVEAISIHKDNIIDAKNKAELIFKEFKSQETYLSLSVNHEDLTNIENSFVDMIGFLSVGDADNAMVAKSRLINSLEHLRRLSSFRLEAII